MTARESIHFWDDEGLRRIRHPHVILVIRQLGHDCGSSDKWSTRRSRPPRLVFSASMTIERLAGIPVLQARTLPGALRRYETYVA